MIKIGILFLCLFSTSVSAGRRELPLKVDHVVNGNDVKVTMTSLRDIAEFEVKEVRGVDGLKVLASNVPAKKDFKQGEMVEVTATVQKGSGRSYLHLFVSSKMGPQNVLIPFGTPSKSGKSATVDGKKMKRHVLRIKTQD